MPFMGRLDIPTRGDAIAVLENSTTTRILRVLIANDLNCSLENDSLLSIPEDLKAVLEDAWGASKEVPGYLLENEAKFLGVLAAITPAKGAIVEIGSYRGRSTVMLAKVAAHYGMGPVVAIDPHNSPILLGPGSLKRSSHEDFLQSVRAANVERHVEAHVAYSSDMSATWTRPVRLLWIDGDHSYKGAKADFEGFLPHIAPNGVIALHDALSNFAGPIRVFVEEMLRSDKFGSAGFVHSIAWSQFRPTDGHKFRPQRERLAQRAAKLIDLVEDGRELRGLKKMRFKLTRSRVPRFPLSYNTWAEQLSP
jgi:predicted O-methyltransferase YrrM